ncbi:MAG: sulfatase-like hydrolase/transferase, partial [Verrucomicrobiota bacterium]
MWSLYFVHTPIESACAWLEKKYDALVPADSPNRAKRVKYGAFVEMLDYYTGQLLDALDDSKNTLVIFTSDNGAHPEYAANAPLRGSKWNLYEGGIRVPFIARWPDRIAAGTESTEPVIGYDLAPTFAELAGVETSPDADGVSISEILLRRVSLKERSLLWHFPYYHPERGFSDAKAGIGINDFVVSQTRPQSAMRRGSHKIVYDYETKSAETYDLSKDIGEQNDLADEDAGSLQLLETLKAELEAAGARDIQPFDNFKENEIGAEPGLCIHEMGTARMG